MNTCYNPFSLEGKTILVTGASSGIGKACAIECAKAGARLILVARNEDRLKTTLSELDGDGHKFFICDLSDSEQIESLVSKIDSLDGLVLCAGIGKVAPIKFSSEKHFKRIFQTNFFSYTEFIRLSVKGKKLNPGSSVVFMDSVGGVTKFTFGNAMYGSSKAALNSYMKFCARELASNKIRVNCVCPGMVETPLIRNGAFGDEQLNLDIMQYPLGRYGQPNEIAMGVLYLLSDASAWVTGISLIIDGGYSIV